MLKKTLKFHLPLYIIPLIFTNLSALTTIPLSEEEQIQKGFAALANEPGAIIFTPPAGWMVADPKSLPPEVKVMIVGKGSHEYPPSINLVAVKYEGTQKQYLATVKEVNKQKNDSWTDLGTIRTEAGDASLSQLDLKSQWGTERLMQVILVKDGMVYILTAAALKDEFPKFYRDFFASLRSLRINNPQ